MKLFRSLYKGRCLRPSRRFGRRTFESLEKREMMAADVEFATLQNLTAPALASDIDVHPIVSATADQGQSAFLIAPDPASPGGVIPNLPPHLQRPFAVDFKWHMKERTGPDYRYGFWSDSRGGDIPNVAGYVNPSEGFEVVLDARSSTTPWGTYFRSVQWTIVGENGGKPLRKVVSGIAPTVRLPEGQYTVTLSITNSSYQTATATGQINVDNILIVSLGDSYASGEGIPHRSIGSHAFWANGGDLMSSLKNQAAHRSILSAPAQAAYMIEQMDPYTSVTFVSMAETGATLVDINEQVRQVGKLTSGKEGNEIDLLFVSGGGNDLQFSTIVEELFWHERGESFAKPEARAFHGLLSLHWKYPLLRYYVDKYLNVDHSRVFVTGYPDPTIGDNLAKTRLFGIMNDVLLTQEIDWQEILWAREHVMQPLDETLSSIVTTAGFGWNYVPMLSALSGHGYDAKDNWIVTWDESMDVQGNDGSLLKPKTSGVMHPNAKGARAMAERLVDAVFTERALEFERPPRVSQIVRDLKRLPVSLGVPYTLEVAFSKPVLVSSFTTSDVRVSAADGSPVRVMKVMPVGQGTEAVRFVIEVLPTRYGSHSLTIGSDICDGDGNLLDQDRDGISRHIVSNSDKDALRTTFEIASAFSIRPSATVDMFSQSFISIR